MGKRVASVLVLKEKGSKNILEDLVYNFEKFASTKSIQLSVGPERKTKKAQNISTISFIIQMSES